MRQRGKLPSGHAGGGAHGVVLGVYIKKSAGGLGSKDLEGPLNEDSIRAKYKHV